MYMKKARKATYHLRDLQTLKALIAYQIEKAAGDKGKIAELKIRLRKVEEEIRAAQASRAASYMQDLFTRDEEQNEMTRTSLRKATLFFMIVALLCALSLSVAIAQEVTPDAEPTPTETPENAPDDFLGVNAAGWALSAIVAVCAAAGAGFALYTRVTGQPGATLEQTAAGLPYELTRGAILGMMYLALRTDHTQADDEAITKLASMFGMDVSDMWEIVGKPPADLPPAEDT